MTESRIKTTKSNFDWEKFDLDSFFADTDKVARVLRKMKENDRKRETV